MRALDWAVLVGTLSIAQGFRQAMTASGSPTVAVVLRSGSNTEMVSFLGGESVRIISEAPGVARTTAGASAGSPAMPSTRIAPSIASAFPAWSISRASVAILAVERAVALTAWPNARVPT